MVQSAHPLSCLTFTSRGQAHYVCTRLWARRPAPFLFAGWLISSTRTAQQGRGSCQCQGVSRVCVCTLHHVLEAWWGTVSAEPACCAVHRLMDRIKCSSADRKHFQGVVMRHGPIFYLVTWPSFATLMEVKDWWSPLHSLGGLLWTPKPERSFPEFLGLCGFSAHWNLEKWNFTRRFQTVSMFYMDILLCVNSSQTPYFVLTSSNPFYKEQNGTE